MLGKVSIQTKMLVIIVPLIVVPMLILAIVGFLTASGEAAKTSTRFLKQREHDLRTIAENLAIRDYYFNQLYGLTDEAEVYRRGLERSLKRFADRSNSIEPIYTQVRYVDQRGVEAVKILYPHKDAAAAGGGGYINSERQQVALAPFFTAVRALAAHQIYTSPIGPTMTSAMPMYQPGEGGQAPTFLGAIVLDFVYPTAGVPTHQVGDHAVVCDSHGSQPGPGAVAHHQPRPAPGRSDPASGRRGEPHCRWAALRHRGA